MSYSINVPLDNGFVRRQCPQCDRQFKWHDGPTPERPNDVAELTVYYCPYCGRAAGVDQWWTRAQLDFIEAAVMGPTMTDLVGEFERSLGDQRDSFVQISVSHDEPEPPVALQEPADMIEVQSPCHGWEPIKVVEEWSGPLHCLVCGAAFAV